MKQKLKICSKFRSMEIAQRVSAFCVSTRHLKLETQNPDKSWAYWHVPGRGLEMEKGQTDQRDFFLHKLNP